MLKLNMSFKRIILSLILISALALVISGCKPNEVPVESITISAANNATTISTMGGTLQFTAVVLPENADDAYVVWSVIEGTGEATISASGLLTAIASGSVQVKAESASNPLIFDTMLIMISNQEILVTSITVSGFGGLTTISTVGGTLQMSAVVLPENAADQSYVWSVVNGTGEATIDEDGLLTAITDGTVDVLATSVTQPLIFGTLTITLSNQTIWPDHIDIDSAGHSNVIDVFRGTLQLTATLFPENATDTSIIWSVENGTGEATIDQNGLLTAAANGTVTVKASATIDAMVYDSMVITISNQEILIGFISVTGFNDASTIETYGGTLQMVATIFPADALDPSVIWSIQNGSGEATIDQNGLLTAVANGTVTVKATANTDPLIFHTMIVTISHQEVYVDSVSVTGFGGAEGISTFGGTLQMIASVLPLNADDPSVIWSIENGTGEATISSTGLVTALSNGTVTVKATSTENALIFDTLVLTLTHQEVLITSISVSGFGGVTTITVKDATLQMVANVLPENADDKSIVWSVANGAGEATIDQNGLLTAVADGTVTVTAASNNQPLISGSRVITISNQITLVTSVDISSAGDAVIIDVFGGTLQFSAVVLPIDADDSSVIWSVENGTGEATIDQNGLLTAVANGTVTVKASATSDALIYSTMLITLSNQDILVSSIEMSSALDAVVIDTFGGTLQFTAVVLPIDAADKSVVWSVENGTGEATIDQNGLLTAVADGTVIVKVAAASNQTIMDTMIITLSNQEIHVTEVIVTSEGDAVIIDTFGGTLQMYAEVLPIDATNPIVIWSVENGTGEATISETGLLSGLVNGTVTVIATSQENNLIFDTFEVTLSNQENPGPIDLGLAGDFAILTETGITATVGTLITGNVGVSPIAAASMTGFGLIMDASGEFATSSLVVGMIYAADYAAPTPAYLTQAVTDMHTAYTDAAGRTPDFIDLNAGDISGLTLVPGVYFWSTALLINADVTLSGSVSDVWIFQISGALTQAATVKVVLAGGAVKQNVVWQVAGAVGLGADAHFEGTILGMIGVNLGAGASLNGKIFAQTALTLDGNIINQEEAINAESVTVSSEADAVEINTLEGTLQMYAEVLPLDASNMDVIWSVEAGTGEATISETGLLSALSNGTVTVKATSAMDPLIFGTMEILLSNQPIAVESVLVSSEGDVIIIDVLEGTLQMYADVLPLDATNPLYTWSVVNGTGQATISEAGLLTAVANGTVTVKATSDQNPLIFDELVITISNQPEVVSYGPVDLGSAADFTILSKTGISATVGTLVTGNIGVSPGPASYITGFSLIMDASGEFATSSLVVGMIYAADMAVPTPSYLSVAVSDMEIAYTDAAGRTPDFVELHAGDISGQTLVPGVYYWSSGVLINSNVTLSGSATDTWIFQIAGTLTQAASVQIILSGGAVAENVVWQVATAVSIGVGAHFEGTILGMTSVNLGTNATMNGKIFAQTAVTLDGNIIN